MASRTQVSAAVVRTWAEGAGLIEAGKVGKLSQGVIDAFKKANKGKEYGGAGVKRTVEVKAMRTLDTGRKVPVSKKIVVGEARSALISGGVPLGKRGRIPEPALQAFVTGTISEYAASLAAAPAPADVTAPDVSTETPSVSS